MKEKVLEYIRVYDMINENDRIVIGVSGGADSICLLELLYQISKEINIKLFVVHINHGIRGAEAEIDEKYVEEICTKYNLPYKSYKYKIKDIVKDKGITEEEAGRIVRYKSFAKACELFNANKIAVAHNKNDNAETILFHLIRGSGIKGLSGIPSKREVQTYKFGVNNTIPEVIRPLLCVSREEIEEYLQQLEIKFRIDSTNLTNNYTRNKLRNKVIAYITKEINVNAIDNIVRAGEHLEEISRYLDKNIDREYNRIVKQEEDQYIISIQSIREMDYVIQKGIIRRIIGNMKSGLKDIESKHVDQVISLYDKSVGKIIKLPNKRIAKRGYNEINFYDEPPIDDNETEAENKYCLEINKIPCRYDLKDNSSAIDIKVLKAKSEIMISKNTCIKHFDCDKIENTIKIRGLEEKDYIQVYKDGGTKKITDFFKDIKIPKEERNKVLLVADGDHIIWILDSRANYRISEKYKINEKTQNILEMKLIHYT